MRGRRKLIREPERLTSFGLRRSLEHGIMELQQRRFLSAGRRPSLKQVIIEALELLLQREAIELKVREPVSAPEVQVLTMPARQVN